MATILERVTKVTAMRLGAKEEAVVPSASFAEDLGADSLDLVELIMGLEEEFSTAEKPVKIPDEDAAKIKTVQDAVDYLKSKGISDNGLGPVKLFHIIIGPGALNSMDCDINQNKGENQPGDSRIFPKL